jgi:hypothetical protein
VPDQVTFDGLTSVVLVNVGIVNLDTEPDLYSAWKRWCVLTTGGFNRDGLKYDPAFRTVAGDPIRADKALGAHFFITNDWHLRPFAGNHELVIEGNLWPEAGEVIYTGVTGTFTVLATVERAVDVLSDIVTVTGTGGDGFTAADRTTITETHDALGTFTGTVVVAEIEGGVVTGVLIPLQALQLDELHAIQGLQTGILLEVSETERRVLGKITQSIEADTPVSGTVRVTRTG